MLDTGRSFFTTDAVCETIRTMGVHKANYLDWHISDDQSFPLSVGPELFTA